MAFDIIHPDADAIECQIVDNVAQLLADSVARTPERVALEFFDHHITLTYTELYEQVRRVASGSRGNWLMGSWKVSSRPLGRMGNVPEGPSASSVSTSS